MFCNISVDFISKIFMNSLTLLLSIELESIWVSSEIDFWKIIIVSWILFNPWELDFGTISFKIIDVLLSKVLLFCSNNILLCSNVVGVVLTIISNSYKYSRFISINCNNNLFSISFCILGISFFIVESRIFIALSFIVYEMCWDCMLFSFVVVIAVHCFNTSITIRFIVSKSNCGCSL